VGHGIPALTRARAGGKLVAAAPLLNAWERAR